jgi:reactive intermediate/imine deaminase
MNAAKQQITSPELPSAAAPLSHGITAGRFVFVSGQTPRDPISGSTPEGIEAQTEVVIKNIERVLTAAGGTLADIVKVTAHLTNLQNRDGFNAVYRRLMPEPFPARTTVGSQLGDILVEVDVIAVLGEAP